MNDLTSKSLGFLALGVWPQLIELNLSHFECDIAGNKISSIGCKFLSRIDLESMKNLYLCKISISKLII